MDTTLYTLVIVIAPILLGAAILWAIMRNRTTPEQNAETEAATRRLYKEQSAEDDAAA